MSEPPIFAIVFIAVMLLGTAFIAGASFGENTERKRIEAKCLVELSSRIHREAVELCKERVK